MIDPRHMISLVLQIDVLIEKLSRVDDHELRSSLTKLREATETTRRLIRDKGLYLQIPHDYKPPWRKEEGDKR